MDDLNLIRGLATFHENIDYYSEEVSTYNLYKCWRQNNSTTVKSSCDDISLIIPSSASKRLENLCWRRWFKDLNNLSVIPPSKINWYKDQDITWLYGPKFGDDSFHVKQQQQQQQQEEEEEEEEDGEQIKEVGTTSTLHSIDIPQRERFNSDDGLLSSSLDSKVSNYSFGSFSSSVSSVENDFNETKISNHIIHSLKPALKLITKGFGKNNIKKDRTVKFNYIVNSREFVSGMSFDYDFLDHRCL